jgi:hypothetical protein
MRLITEIGMPTGGRGDQRLCACRAVDDEGEGVDLLVPKLNHTG